MENRLPRITFGYRAFNGEPMVRYNLRGLYPFAAQILVAEGAVSAAAEMATPQGHSTDGTLEALRDFKENEDPEGKLEIVTKDGFWEEADEQSRAFAHRATGDYLWIVDVDEFYRPDDIGAVLEMLMDEPDISAVFFKQITFWGGFDYVADGWYLRQRQGEGPGIVPRVIKWERGYRYVAHRPLTVHDRRGRNVVHGKAIDGAALAKRGIFMYHYSLVFPRQVSEKARYYSQARWASTPHMKEWAEDAFMQLNRPFRVHNVYRYPSWLDRFDGRHPDQIEALRSEIASGRVSVEMRRTDDIERLLESPLYRAGRWLLKALIPPVRVIARLRRYLKRIQSRGYSVR